MWEEPRLPDPEIRGSIDTAPTLCGSPLPLKGGEQMELRYLVDGRVVY